MGKNNVRFHTNSKNFVPAPHIPESNAISWEEELIDLLDRLPTGMMLIDLQKNIRRINKAALTIAGYSSPDEVIGKKCYEFFSVKTRDHCPIIEDELQEEKDESWIISTSGEKIPVFKTVVKTQFMGEEMILESFVDLREFKQVQDDLGESQRMLKTLMGNLPGMVYQCYNDKQWTMVFVSQGCKSLTGYSTSDLINNKKIAFNEVIHPEDRELVWKSIQQRITKNEAYSFSYRIISADQTIKWVKDHGRAIGSRSDEIILEGFITDVSEEKRNQLIGDSVFEISKASYISNSLDKLLCVIHEQLNRILDASNFFVALYDKTNDTITLPYHVDFKDKFAAFPAGKTMTGHVISLKAPVLATESDIIQLASEGKIEIIGTPTKVWMGAPLIVNQEVTGVIAVQNYTNENSYSLQDLSLLTFVADQVAGLLIRKRTEEQLREEQAYLDQLYQSSTEAITMINNQGIVLSINKEFSQLFGYSNAEATGRNIDDLIVPKYLHDEGVRITSQSLTNERIEVESTRQHKNGILIDVSILVTPIFIEDELVGAYGIYRDITERKRIEKSLIVAKEKAEESDRLKSAFLSNMSHEIRTPMNAILGFSSLLSDPEASREEREEYIDIIKERGNDLMRIINDIIDIAKIESGQLKINIKDCKVNAVLNDLHTIFSQIKAKQEKREVELRTSLAVDDPDFTILSDPQRLRQVITNLIENALKFTESGYIEFGYSITEDTGLGKSIEFFVEDTGIGIPVKMHNVIFERFRQVDDSHTRKYGGTGLGLTICKNLVHLMGGELSLVSQEGKGTRFIMTLPMWTISSPLAMIQEEKSKTGEVNWKEKVILIAEDEESNYIFLEHVLKRSGVKLLWAKDGKEAVNIVEQERVDLVLMDIRMPIMDGYEATEIIKKTHAKLPIIAQTAYALKGEKDLSIKAGCDDYISKPIDIAMLKNLLQHYLR